MATTVLEALQNAQINFDNLNRMSGGRLGLLFSIAKIQLDNAVTALENGMQPDDVIQESLGDDVKVRP